MDISRFLPVRDLKSVLPARGVEAAENLFDVVRRRYWSKPGRIHVELPDLDSVEYGDYVATLRRELEELDGVYWARANGATGRMIVAWDPECVESEQILAKSRELEQRYGFGEGDYDPSRPDHPGDDEPVLRTLLSIGAACVGMGLGVAMKVLRRRPGRRQFDTAALTSVLDNYPHLRDLLAERIGRLRLETSLSLTSPVAQGAGSGPMGPTLTLIYRCVRLLEVVERRRAWLSREAQLCARPDDAATEPPREHPRPVDIPEGPLEEYADDAWNISVGGFLVGLADTQEFESAVTALLDALPKPGRFGRESFCASLTNVMANRDLVVMNSDALRRLDRIDCVIVEDSLLVTDRYRLDRIACADDIDPVAAFERANELFEPLHPERFQSEDGWVLAPADDFSVDTSWVRQLRDRGARGDFLVLADDGGPRALFSLRAITEQASANFVKTIRQKGLELIIVTDHPRRVRSFEPDRIKEYEGIHRFVRHIQNDHQVVAYIGNGPSSALHFADCSVGFSIRGASIPWGADVIADTGLEDATFVVEAIDEARTLSRRFAVFAGAGAGIGALSAIRGIDKTRPVRVSMAVNTASLIALCYGLYRAQKLGERIKAPPDQPVPWHRLRIGDVFERLDSARHGLSTPSAQSRRTGEQTPRGRPWRLAKSIGSELANPLTPLLAGGAAVSAVVGSLADAAIVGTVIAFNGLVGGIERFKAEEVIDEMARRKAIEVETRRDGDWIDVAADELVVGDVIRLGPGDVVPADCRIVESDRLEIDESTLTGESLPVSKDSTPSFSSLPSERSSMLYDDTAVVAGSVTAVVVATGADTEIRSTHHVAEAGGTDGVEARLQELSEMTLPLVGATGGLSLSLGVLRRRELQELVGPAVNLAVGAVPEGLPLLATAAQLAAARRLAERNVIVQNPRAMEAVGRADILCVDKTGTLTRGTMELDGVFDGTDYADETELSARHRTVLRTALRATPVATGQRSLVHGTDRAVVEGADACGVDSKDWEPRREVPFRTERAFHATLGRSEDGMRLAVKGSPEAVLERCAFHRSGEKTVELDGEARGGLLEKACRLAARGLRVLAVARRPMEDDGDLDASDVQQLRFCGFVAFSDPVRQTASEAVEELREAGVSVMMLTGDHPETARRVARRAGIPLGAVLTGPEIGRMSDEQLSEALERTTVVARMTPAHKVRIVEALQEAGHAVAMTGDGGNDAAAIRLADAGVALGEDCATAARDAADLVVLDARVSTLVDAVVEGRGMWRSVRDAVSILVGGNLGEILFMLGSGVVATIPALNARQLLLVNLFTDVAPALAIALRPPPEVSPRQLLHEGPEESLGEPLRRDITWRAAVTGGSAFGAWMLARYTLQKKRASTIGLVTVVCSQLGQTLTTAESGPPVWLASFGSAAGLLALIETPGVSHLLGCRPLGPVGLTTAFGASAAATAGSVIIPRVPDWTEAVRNFVGTSDEPTPGDFLDEYCSFSMARNESERDSTK